MLPWWFRWKWICLQCRRLRFNPWVGKISWRRIWQPTPVFLPGESHRRRGLAGYSPWGRKELDITELLIHTHTHTHTHPYMEEYGFPYWTPAQQSDMKGITECFQWNSLHLSKYKCRMKKTSKGLGDPTKWKMLMKENGPVGQILFLKMKKVVCKVVSKMLQLYIHWDFAFWELAFGFTNEFISLG